MEALNQEQLLRMLLEKEVQIKERDRRIKKLERKVMMIENQGKKIKQLETKIYKLQKVITHLENRKNKSKLQKVQKVYTKQDIRNQIKVIDQKFQQMKVNKKPLQTITNTHRSQTNNTALLNLINSVSKHHQNKQQVQQVYQSRIPSTEHYALPKFNKFINHEKKTRKKLSKTFTKERQNIQNYPRSQLNKSNGQKLFYKLNLCFTDRHSLHEQPNGSIYSIKNKLLTDREPYNTYEIQALDTLNQSVINGCDDLEKYRKQRLKTTNDASQFLKVHKCYSGYSTPTKQQKAENNGKRCKKNKVQNQLSNLIKYKYEKK